MTTENTYIEAYYEYILPTRSNYYGSYYDINNHANLGTTAENKVPLSIVSIQNNVSVVNDDIVIQESGTYRIQYSLQFTNTSNAEQYADVWIKINGQNVTDSNSSFGVTRQQSGKDGRVVAVTDFYFNVVPNDVISIYWHSDSLDVSLQTLPPRLNPVVPRTPSVIVNINAIQL